MPAGLQLAHRESAFGGLTRKFDAATVLKVIELKSDDEPRLVTEVTKYIQEAKTKAARR